LAFKKVKSKIKTRWVYLSAFSPRPELRCRRTSLRRGPK